MANWTTSDLPVPEGADIEKAWLYVYYTWDKNGIMPNGVSLAFNGPNVLLARDYYDRKGFGTSNYPYGMLVYDVTDEFDATGNTAVLTKATTDTYIPIKGMLLMVVYNHPDEPERIICIDEGYDMINAQASYAVTPEEATTYAPFECCEPIPLSEIGTATLVAIAPGASMGDDKNRLSFNDGLWQGAWNGFPPCPPGKPRAPELGIAEENVLPYLKADGNVANFQDRGDWMEASNAFLILETSYSTGEATDPTGRTKDVYYTDEIVYATGSGFVPNSTLRIYITEDKHWEDGMAINSTVFRNVSDVPVDGDGNITGFEMWPNPRPGEYDMVFDQDQDGFYNAGRDAVDHWAHSGFTVLGQVPALTPVGIAALVGLLTIIATSTILRKRKKR